MVLVLRNTLVGGRRAGLHTATGILCGNLIHISYCLLSIGLLISRSILAFSVLKYAAAAYHLPWDQDLSIQRVSLRDSSTIS
jgi:threonine/homoserine/homoserine lactone efflux protein